VARLPREQLEVDCCIPFNGFFLATKGRAFYGRKIQKAEEKQNGD